MTESPEEEPNELALVMERKRRKWLSRIQQGGGGSGGCGCGLLEKGSRDTLRDWTNLGSSYQHQAGAGAVDGFIFI